jgi:hypothetical protein
MDLCWALHVNPLHRNVLESCVDPHTASTDRHPPGSPIPHNQKRYHWIPEWEGILRDPSKRKTEDGSAGFKATSHHHVEKVLDCKNLEQYRQDQEHSPTDEATRTNAQFFPPRKEFKRSEFVGFWSGHDHGVLHQGISYLA